MNAQIVELARRSIATGYLRRDQVVDAIAGQATNALDPGDVSTRVGALWDERLRTQSRWSGTTDCDRLDAAFGQLRAAGLLARQHYGCCLRHGFERLAADPEANTAEGFVFFSEPDTAHAVDGRGLRLAYGAFAAAGVPAGERAERILAVGRMAMRRLRSNGLEVRWPEDVDQRIQVDLDWERRLPADAVEPVG